MLDQVAEKVLSQAIKPGLVAYCPTMDLIALATADEQTHVFRLNGQRVFGVSNKNSNSPIRFLTWKPNGRLLAAAYEDSIVLLNAYTGKQVHQIDRPSHISSPICWLGWGASFINAEDALSKINSISGDFSLDDILSKGFTEHEKDLPVDLPAEAALLDIENVLPKLSTLPAGGIEDDIFSSRASLDAIFHRGKTGSNEYADVLLVGFENGTVQLSIYDFFEIGEFMEGVCKPGHRLVRHSSHLLSSTHSLLTVDDETRPRELCFVPMDLRFMSGDSTDLATVASKSTQIANLLKYLCEAQKNIYVEFKNSQDLPKRFMRNIDETLEEKDLPDFETAAFHLAATGHCPKPVKEWLKDELGERNHKRWEKAASSGYENMCRYLQHNMMPALDRLGVLMSRLSALADAQFSSYELGIDTTIVRLILDTMDCLQALLHVVLEVAGEEQDQFQAFSRWLKQEIETQSLDRGPASLEDAGNKYSLINYDSVLDYINGPMKESAMYEYFGLQDEEDERESWVLTETDFPGPLYDSFKVALMDSLEDTPAKKLPSVDYFMDVLNLQCKRMFKMIAMCQRQKVCFGEKVVIEKGDITAYDVKTMVEGGSDVCTSFVASAKKKSQYVRLHRIRLKIEDGTSSAKETTSASICLPSNYTVEQLRFADDDTLICLLKGGQASLAYFPYQGLPADEVGLVYAAGPADASSLDLSDESALQGYLRHDFEEGISSQPRSMYVNGLKGRRAICTVAEDNIHYRVLDMDSMNEPEDAMDMSIDPS